MKTAGPVNRNDDIALKIDSLGSEGQGVGRYEGLAVFVPFALPNEHIKAHIIKAASNYAVGKLTAVEVPSKDRREPRCSSFTRCGGCNLLHMDYAAQLEYKRNVVANALMRIGKPHRMLSVPSAWSTRIITAIRLRSRSRWLMGACASAFLPRAAIGSFR